MSFLSLQEHVDTTGAVGRFTFHIFGALAEFERDLIRERTMAGLRAARARGKTGGRPKKMTDEKVQIVARLMADGETPVQEICETLGVSRATAPAMRYRSCT